MSKMLADERMRRVLGISSTGFPIFPIAGAEGEEDENGGNDGGGEGGNGGGGSGDGEGSSGSGSGEGEALPKTYSADEYDTILRRLRAADEAKGRAEKKLKELDDAEKSELELANKNLADAKARIAKLEEDAVRAKMANAILQFPGFTWHDPEVVLQVVDMDLIEIDEESGKVKGIKTALDKLAKDKPYLLKSKNNSNGNDGKGGGSNGSGGGSGSSGHNPQGGQADDKNKRRNELAKKYHLH